MAVTLLSFVDTYLGNGSTTAFPLTFAFLETEDLVVKVTRGGVATTLVLGHEYSVAGANAGEGAGTVTLVTPPPAGSTVEISRLVPITQLIDFRNQGPFTPAMWEYAADKLTMILQQLAAGVIDVTHIVGGETNGGANINTEGVGVFDSKLGTTLQFRGVAAKSGKIAVSYDSATKTIRVDLGTVKPEDVGAAPESLVETVNNHETRLKNVEPRRPVSARGYYVWDGSKYVRTSSYDPSSILPAAATASSVGVVDINFLTALPNADYRVTALTSTTTADKPARVCWRHAKSNTKLTLLLTTGAEDVPTHVYAFTVCVDWAEA